MSIESATAHRPVASSSVTTRSARVSPGLVLGAAALTMGLLAGLFYAYAVSVMPGLANSDDRTLVDGMQHINVAIENPVFFLSFIGAPLLAGWAFVQARRSGSVEVVRWIAAALVLYGIAFVVTGALNIPLNNDLKNAGTVNHIGNVSAVRDHFLTPWIAWNVVRTVASTAALGCLGYALVLYGRATAKP